MTEATETEVVDQVDQVDQESQESEESKRERLEREHYDEIRELNVKFVAAHQQWEILKDQTSGAKKRCDELGKRLSNLIARGPDLQTKLNFDQAKPEAEDGEPAEAIAEDDNAWRDVVVTEALGLTASQLDKLEEEGIRTMGQLEDFRGSKGLRSIKGFGEKAVDKIEDQILDWLDDYRDRFGEPIEEDDPEEEPEDQDDDPEDEGEDNEAEDNDADADADADADELLDEL